MSSLRLVSARLKQAALFRTIPPSACLSKRWLATAKEPSSPFESLDTFVDRHVGPDDDEAAFMLSKLGYHTMEDFLNATVPQKIRIPDTSVNESTMSALSESQLQARARALGARNSRFKSYIGMGYHNAVVPPVILRNVGHARTAFQSPTDACGRSWKIPHGTLRTLPTSPRSPKVSHVNNIYAFTVNSVKDVWNL